MNPRDLINDVVALDTVIKLLGKGEFEIAHHKVKDILEAKKEALRDMGLRPESFKKREKLSIYVKRMRELNANT